MYSQKPANLLSLALLPHLLIFFPSLLAGDSVPLNCTEPTCLCASFLAFRISPTPTAVALLKSMFDVAADDLTVDPISSPGIVFVRKNCSCLFSRRYLTNTTYTLHTSDGDAFGTAAAAYGGLAASPPSNLSPRSGKEGSVIPVHLLCGCSRGLWNYLLTYVAVDSDTVESLASRFGVSMDSLETANGLPAPGPLVAGDVYYIPLNDVPGQPYESQFSAVTPAPAPAQTFYIISGSENHPAKFPYVWVIGGMGIALALVAAALFALIIFKSSTDRDRSDGPDQSTPCRFKSLRRNSFCCVLGNAKQSSADLANQHVGIPSGMAAEAFDNEKPIVFNYGEMLSATDSFSDANLLGYGTYGSVYYGVLRDQEVAVKRMTATKTKEFIVEMRVLCKVHHSSLVELIGYAASTDELFLVYEYAQKGALKNHLHNPQNRGHTPLSWISRVQIALDAARGLEYIHEHTKDHYVHRDIKTSNILLDGSFRAKISDFGLAKLVAKSNDAEASVTKVVGTFGYLAPEYLRDGLATTKCDVYAFGVVLFELISGREAITRADGATSGNSEKRSLASIMLSSLKTSPSSTSMSSLRELIDANMMDLYPHDCVYKMAMLAKQCVEEDPILRPDMKQMVISLSQILLSSVEWEATLAGNSQVFSGLVQGR